MLWLGLKTEIAIKVENGEVSISDFFLEIKCFYMELWTNCNLGKKAIMICLYNLPGRNIEIWN